MDSGLLAKLVIGPRDFARARWLGPGMTVTEQAVAAMLAGIGVEPEPAMIRKLSSGKYRLYSRKVNPKTGRRRNLGTFASRAAAQKHERAVQYFKRG
jgi:hypothetical protein